MKKIIGLVTLVLFISAIAITGVFGLNIGSSGVNVYPESVTITKIVDMQGVEYPIVLGSNNKKTCTVKRYDNYQMHWIVLPDDTTDKNVKITSDGANSTVDKNGAISIIDRSSFTITISCNLYNGIKDNITLQPYLN